MVASVLLAVDVEDPASLAKPLDMARRLFQSDQVALHVLYVLPPFEMSIVGSFFPEDYEAKALETAKTRLAEMAAAADLTGLARPELHVAHGVVYEELLAAADSLAVDMIIVGAHRPQLKDYLLGPNAARVARHAKQSVLVLRD
ncbi:MAG: universal stress protein [Pseudomonadota bacterium]